MSRIMNVNNEENNNIQWHSAIWICGASVVIIGILGLIGRLSEIYIIGSYIPEIKPLESTVSICYVFLGSIMYMYGRKMQSGIYKITSITALFLIILFGLVIFICSFLFMDIDKIQFISGNIHAHTLIYREYPSSVGALLIMLSSLSLFLLLTERKNQNPIGILGLIIALSGLVILIYYASGIPQHSSFIIPISFPAAIATLLLGIGTILSAGTNCFITKPLLSSASISSLLKYFIPIIIFTEILSDLIHDIFVHKYNVSNPFVSEVITIISTIILVISFSAIAYFLSRALQKNEAELKQIEKEKEEIEKQLIQAQKIETVGHLAAGIAHDFNNFLAGIQANFELAKRNIPDKERDKSSEFFNQIEILIARSSAIINQILSFSNKSNYRPKLLIVNDLVTEAVNILKHSEAYNVNITCNLSADIWLVEADPAMMTQVLLNLGLNAQEAMPCGGKLLIKTENVHIDEKAEITLKLVPPGDYVNIRFSDTGKGISEEIIHKIFNPFFTTKPTSKGSGLGLSIVYNIIKQSSGYIFVESQEGHGAIFNIYLPAKKRETTDIKENKTVPGLPNTPSCKKVLVADDEDYIRIVIKRILNDAGIDVILAVNGEEAIDKYKQFKNDISLVILDIKMPVLNGIEVYNQITKINPLIKTVFITGYTEAKDIPENKSCIIIKKPFHINEFIQNIASLLEKEQ